jgi:hypothetical protein
MVDMATANDDDPGRRGPGTDEAEPARRCLACGYNLFGLGDEPRCPECGLLNIPDGYRRQVWELVDSGRWFFSSFLGFARKRPPGWWWALDRPGDVRRSFKFAGRFVLLACVMIFAAGAVADAVRVEMRWTWSYYSLRVPNAPSQSTILDCEQVIVSGLGSIPRRNQLHQSERKGRLPGRVQPIPRSSTRVLFEPSLAFISESSAICAIVLCMWAGPALVGLWTQIRKGLPAFARAPRTIIAAANYESHRLVYLTLCVGLWMAADAVFRVVVLVNNPTALMVVLVLWPALLVVATVMGACGWIGPLRSDYTRQLIRSRKHAVRLVLMYAVALPWVLGGTTWKMLYSSMW